jgi:signal transduction histidine kinase/ActR/RegA family two-component response regulator
MKSDKDHLNLFEKKVTKTGTFEKSYTSFLAIILGIVSVLISLSIGFFAYKYTLKATEKRYHMFYMNKAKMLASIADSHKDTTKDILLNIIETCWMASGDKPPDEYICIVDKDANLILHTAHPDTIGKYVGNNIVLDSQGKLLCRMQEIIQSQVDYVGNFISSSGQKQIAAFAAIPQRQWTVGVHRSKDALIKGIKDDVFYFIIGFVIVCGFFLPVSLVFLYGTFKASNQKRMNAEKELVRMQKLESVGILAGGIAHDFNNYLQGILSNIAVAKSHTDSNDKIHFNLTESEKAVIQAKSLTQQLLTFSKGGDPIMKVISASELIQDSANFSLSGSNVRCELVLPDCRCLVEVDKGQISQVFNNLFINADQAMPNGGVIKVNAEHYNVEKKDLLPLQEGRYVKIIVNDQGIGISQEHLQNIFDPYFTTKEMGSGLGLATSFSIIKKHDGHIMVESEIGVGTTFYIYLPASQKEITNEPVEGAVDKKNIEKITSLDKRRILFMEDESIISLAVARQLRNLNYEVETARDGFEAIELYQRAMESSEPFIVVILDLTIPGGMGGEETIKKLLEIDHNVKAVVASGYANDPIMANFKESGFRGMVEKPYEIAELEEVLQKVIVEKQT